VVLLRIVIPAVFLAVATVAWAGSNSSAEALGQKIHNVQKAINNPDQPESLQAVLDLGLDSRYYTLVHGWLNYQLQGDRSIVDASAPGTRPQIEARIRFLEKAIRAIDLE
jgi:hypothetical protein